MSNKLNSQILSDAIDKILAYSAGETITINGEEVQGKKPTSSRPSSYR